MWKIISIIYFLTCCSFSESATLKVSVYYETLCPDCTSFIVKQFWGAYNKIGAKYFDMDYIPYGFASESNETGKWVFDCQHGTKECDGNRFHGCVIANAQNQEQLSSFIYCSENVPVPGDLDTLKTCATTNNFSLEDVYDNCYKTDYGTDLVIQNGKRTRAIEHLSFIPTIIFNDKYDKYNQNQAMSNFFKIACDLLDNEPSACQNQ